ncbi:MAG: Holliday junction resolvase RuvX [Candidatus Omnitrophota bacterium]|nr:Holliday junction resolvase RuvX [Candidatus Omnitrophota bacterium]
MRIMGLDVGTKNIGVALGDETCTIAQAKGVVRREKDSQAITCIVEILEEFDVKEIVVGLPIHMDGREGLRAEDSKNFAKKLQKKTGLPVHLWDERLSTKEMEDVLIKADVSRKKRKKVIDKLAAQIILQGYLDCRQNR